MTTLIMTVKAATDPLAWLRQETQTSQSFDRGAADLGRKIGAFAVDDLRQPLFGGREFFIEKFANIDRSPVAKPLFVSLTQRTPVFALLQNETEVL